MQWLGKKPFQSFQKKNVSWKQRCIEHAIQSFPAPWQQKHYTTHQMQQDRTTLKNLSLAWQCRITIVSGRKKDLKIIVLITTYIKYLTPTCYSITKYDLALIRGDFYSLDDFKYIIFFLFFFLGGGGKNGHKDNTITLNI